MTQIDELDAMKSINDILSDVDDPTIVKRILTWILDKYGINTLDESLSNKKSLGKKSKTASVAKTRKKTGNVQLKINKTLNLKPSDKTTFIDFAGTKSPSSIIEKIVLCVYYLKNTIKSSVVTVDDVFTCFKYIRWRLPSDMVNMMQQASTAGYLDTKGKNDIQVAIRGDNLIEHDLPKSKK